METYEDKNRENKKRSVANVVSQKKGNNTPSFRFVDNRPESVQIRKWQKADDNYVEQKNSSAIMAIQRKFTF